MLPLLPLFVSLLGALPWVAGEAVVVSCVRDALFTSLYRQGRSFCSDLLENPCGKVTAPPQYLTNDFREVSSQVGLRCCCG